MHLGVGYLKISQKLHGGDRRHIKVCKKIKITKSTDESFFTPMPTLIVHISNRPVLCNLFPVLLECITYCKITVFWILRLNKKKNSVSKLPHAFIFLCASVCLENGRFIFVFNHFFKLFLSKISHLFINMKNQNANYRNLLYLTAT